MYIKRFIPLKLNKLMSHCTLFINNRHYYFVLTLIISFSNQEDTSNKFVGKIITGSKGGVAVEAEQCSEVGVKILQKGGNAVDSAIASALCIGVIDNFATGIGG
ncbi:unnamed protein product [Cunninghamella blakesleeana]